MERAERIEFDGALVSSQVRVYSPPLQRVKLARVDDRIDIRPNYEFSNPFQVSISDIQFVRQDGDVTRIDLKDFITVIRLSTKDAQILLAGTGLEPKETVHQQLLKRMGVIWGGLALLVLVAVAGSNILSWAAANSLTPKYEKQLGKAVIQGILNEYPVDTSLTRLSRQFCKNLNFPDDHPFRVLVVKSEINNAVTLPGNTIVVFSGILENLASADEYAGLLGHEYGHIKGRHVTKGLSDEFSLRILTSSLNTVASSVSSSVMRVSESKYSRELESEADLVGQQVLRSNGLDPYAMTGLLSALATEDVGGIRTIFDTHPSPSARINAIIADVNKKGMPAADSAKVKTLTAIWLQIEKIKEERNQQ